MTREEKIYELRGFCNMQDSCDQCGFDELSVDCDFNKMNDKKINEFYEIMVGYKTKIEDITKEHSKTVAEITGAAKEDSEKSKTVTDILEEVKQEMCDGYCKYPTIVNDREDLFAKDGPCMECLLNKL